MELFLHRFGGSRFRESKDRGKCQAHNYLACNLVALLLGQGTKKVGTERKIVCRRLKIIRLRLKNRLAQKKTRAK